MNSVEKVFITGSSGGIGSAITKKFIDVGYKLILISSSKEKLSTMKNEYGDLHSYYHINYNRYIRMFIRDFIHSGSDGG